MLRRLVSSPTNKVRLFSANLMLSAPQTCSCLQRLPSASLIAVLPSAVSYTHLDVYKRQNYDHLDSGFESDHSQNVSSILRAVSPESFIYCRNGSALPEDSDLNGVNGNPPIHIVTQSASGNDTISYNTSDRDWDNFSYHNKIAMFNSAGNTGQDTGNIKSPGKGLNVITVGNYDDANDTINSTSPYVNPETGNDKPEIVAPGTTVTAGGFTYTGTSQSTPHAAAFAADIISRQTVLQYRPWWIKARLVASATDPIGGCLLYTSRCV